MAKRPTNGGVIANRGFIFQAIIAEIQCLERNDWDAIKVEPETTLDKVDIMLYKDGKIISAMQVKSSKNPFERSDVKKWLEQLRADAGEAEEICLYLVGKSYKPLCEVFIWNNRKEIKKVPFKHIQNICIGELVEYIRKAGVGGEVRVDDIEFIDDALFAKLFKNSIAKEPISRAAFEERFQKALPVHIIPKCLTSIPTINHVVGLVGRDDIKKSIRKMLEENDRTALVNGLGGIGKTAVMQYVCNDLKNEGKYVAWIECGESLKEDLLLLRTALGIPESDDAEKAYGKVLYELQANRQLASNLYLFLDNLSHVLGDEEQEDLNRLGIHVMATSRFEHEYFENIPLDVLVEDAALDMFYGYYLEKQKDKTRRHVEAAKEIIESVQSHTMLVELLAKAAWKKGGTLEAFRDDLKKRGVLDVFKNKLNTKHDKNRTIEECVMELYKISKLTPEQQRIMKLFTIFTPERVVYYKISEWADLDMDAMGELVDLGWLARGGLETGYQIHQIVKNSLQRQLKKDNEKIRLEDYGGFLYIVGDTDSYLLVKETYGVIRERIGLTEDVAGYLWDEYQTNTEKDEVWARNAGTLMNNLALVYKNQGDYKKALEYNGRALDIKERMLGTEHPGTATTYNNMAMVYNVQGDYEKALEYNGKALAIRERVLGTGHPDTATTYNNMGGVYEDQGDYEKALEYYGKALAVRERVLETEHPDTATTYNNMAGAYYAQGDYEKALEYFGKALAIKERLEPEHPDTATMYNNMAEMYHAKGDYEKALEYHGKALTIREHVLGPEHPDTATTYNNMAEVYYAQGDYEKTLEYHDKALAIYERVLGTEHPNTGTTYNNVAGLYYTQGEYEKALEYYGKDLAIRERVLGTEHPSTATTYNNMAGVYKDQGEYEKALEYYGKALAVRERVLGTEHPNTGMTYNNVAGLYYAQGDYEKALEYYRKALAICERELGPEHPDTATTYNNMASVYDEQGDYEKAQEYYGKARAIRERVLGTEHPDTATTYNNMAGAYYAQGYYEKALKYYGKALAIRERVFGMEHPDTATSYNNMAFMYQDQGDYEKALEYYGKALAVSERVFGTEHPSTATIYNNMGGVYQAQGDYEKALEYCGKALAISERVLGREHPNTAMTYNNIAWVYQAQGDYEKALEYYKIAYAVRLSVFGENHPKTQDTQLSIKTMELLIATGMTEDELEKSLPEE